MLNSSQSKLELVVWWVMELTEPLKLGYASAAATSLGKILSVVVARCSYAIYLAKKSKTWSHNTDLVTFTQ